MAQNPAAEAVLAAHWEWLVGGYNTLPTIVQPESLVTAVEIAKFIQYCMPKDPAPDQLGC